MLEPVLNLGPDSQHVPVQAGAESNASIGKAMNFMQTKTAAVPAAIHYPAARCARVNGDKTCSCAHRIFGTLAISLAGKAGSCLSFTGRKPRSRFTLPNLAVIACPEHSHCQWNGRNADDANGLRFFVVSPYETCIPGNISIPTATVKGISSCHPMIGRDHACQKAEAMKRLLTTCAMCILAAAILITNGRIARAAKPRTPAQKRRPPRFC